MDSNRVPAGLRERLGTEATAGLVDLFNDAQAEWRVDVISAASDRFERRLVEETSKLRLEMVQGFGALRQELRQDTSSLRQEMASSFATVRQEIADTRFEILKWAFVFWVGQFFAMAGLVAVLIRFLRPGG